MINSINGLDKTENSHSCNPTLLLPKQKWNGIPPKLTQSLEFPQKF